MRHFSCCVLMLVLVGLCDTIRAEEGALSLSAGAYAADITPERFPISINGNTRDGQATHAHDPLHARCLYLANGQTKLAIVVVDSCMLPRETIDAAKQAASEATGIPGSNMLISATHTHSAPTSAGVFQSEPDADYRPFLIRRIAEGITQAMKQAEPAQIGFGSAYQPSQVFNRRWHVREGQQYENPFGGLADRVRMNPGYASPIVDRPAGPTDSEISLLSVQARDGRPLCLLANYSLHYVGGVEANVLSADYFGEFADRVKLKIGANKSEPTFVGIMSNGTSGNINNVNFSLTRGASRQPYDQISLVAESVALATAAVYKSINYQEEVPLAVRETELELGVRKPTPDELAAAEEILKNAPTPLVTSKELYARESKLLAAYPDTMPVKVQVLRIGPAAIVAIPCETFVETGLVIKEQSPHKPTFTISLTNGYNGYLPTPEHHAWGGYETWRARSSYLVEDAEPKIRATVFELLRDMP